MTADTPQPVAPPSTERRSASPGNVYRRTIFGVPVTVTVSIGQQRMSVAELLELRADSVIALTAMIDDPVDLTVDDRVIARGELLETEDGSLAVRLTEILDREND